MWDLQDLLAIIGIVLCLAAWLWFGWRRPSPRGSTSDVKPKAESSSGVLDTRIVEDIVGGLRQKPPLSPVCHVVLFGDRPLTAVLQGTELDILCFTQRGKADAFMQGYQRIYHCTKPLTALSLGRVEELWAMLNNKANDPDYEPPYGLLINFNYAGRPYNRYGLADLKRIGPAGLKKGLSAVS